MIDANRPVSSPSRRARTLAGTMFFVGAVLVASSGAALPPVNKPPERGPKPPATFLPPPPPSPSTCVSPRFTDAQLLTLPSLTNPPASHFWCGNRWKLRGRPDKPDADPRTTPCSGLASDGAGARIPAAEKTEVRGWLRPVAEALFHRGEAEFIMEVEPDVGWSPVATDVVPLNTLERVSSVMTPFQGGDGAGNIKIEFNLWGPARPCTGVSRIGVETVENPTLDNYADVGQYCAAYTALRPPESCFTNPDTPHAFWPFDPQHPPHTSDSEDAPLHAGDYVRIVGTIWEDDPHHKPVDAQPCEHGGHSGNRGWPELHPIDFIARMKAPPGKTTSGIAYVGACIPPGNGSKNVRAEVPPATPRPGPNFQLKVHEAINRDFTNLGSLAPASATEASRVSVVADTGRVSVTVLASAGRGLFRSAYLASWEPCTPSCQGQCTGAPNGCGGMCTNACAAGHTCSSGNCCPAGQKWCGGQCLASCPREPCSPCSCGGSSCDGSAACAHACRAQGK